MAYCGRCGGLMVSALNSGLSQLRIVWSGFEPWPGTLYCVLEILLVTSCYRNWDKHQPDWPLGSSVLFR